MSVLVPLLAAVLSSASPEPANPHGAPVTEHASPSTQAAPVEQGASAEHGAVPAEHGGAAGEHGGAAETHGAPGEGHEGGAHGPAEILMHHVSDEPWAGIAVGALRLPFSKHVLFIMIAGAAVLVLLRLAIGSYRHGKLPTGPAALVETILVFIRDEIAEKNIGHDGRKFTPLLASFFFFILFAALIGLTPFSATPTGNVSVTVALALISFVAAQWAGISKYGVVHHYMGMIPPGLPKFLVPIMIPVEILGMFARPFALTVRLFANMLAGHMVITTLLLLIPIMARVHTMAGVAMTPVSLALGLFIMFLEVLVAFLQAFIFTLLSAIFIGMSAHPAH
jgi:F-type H+-transporting ATPase subunit a